MSKDKCSCPIDHSKEKEEQKKKGDFVTSAIIGGVTNSAIIGTVLGGDPVGAILGDIFNGGDLFD